SFATSSPPIVTWPMSGESVPAINLRSVVLPEPLGPRRPTIVPCRTSKDTLSSTSRALARRSYANETLSTCSNANSHHRAASQCRISECFLVSSIRQVQDARRHVDAAGDAHARAGVDVEVSRRKEQTAETSEVRLDVEDFGSSDHFGEGREARIDVCQIRRALVARPPDQRIADVKRRRRDSRRAI